MLGCSIGHNPRRVKLAEMRLPGHIEAAYDLARERYVLLGMDTGATLALGKLRYNAIPTWKRKLLADFQLAFQISPFCVSVISTHTCIKHYSFCQSIRTSNRSLTLLTHLSNTAGLQYHSIGLFMRWYVRGPNTPSHEGKNEGL